MNKYEQLIEYIINDNEKAARELFHQIVVAKSRDIYESLMDEELGGNQAQGFMNDVENEVSADQEGVAEDDEEFGDEFGDEDDGEDMDDEDGEDFGDEEFGDEEFGGDMEDEGSVEDRVMDLETELDTLKAEFDKLLGGDESGSGMDDMGDDMGDEMDDMGSEMDGEDDMGGEFGHEEPEDSMMEAGNPFAKKGSGASGKSGSGKSGSGKSGSGKSGSGKSGSGKSGSGNPFAKKGSGASGSGKMESRGHAEVMKEYVDKVKDFYKGDTGEGHEIGTGGSVNVNKTSITDNMKNDFGGSSANIARGGAEADPDGQKPHGKAGGFVKPAQEIDVAKRNVNKPGGNKGAENFFSTKAKAKPAEGSTTDGSVPVSKDSLLKARK